MPHFVKIFVSWGMLWAKPFKDMRVQPFMISLNDYAIVVYGYVNTQNASTEPQQRKRSSSSKR
jgi:hypothetical protein